MFTVTCRECVLRKICEGAYEEVAADTHVQQAYLGIE